MKPRMSYDYTLQKNVRGKPWITVSAKGISNGLSDIPNDGADFGPDTPGTQTTGIQEAINYAIKKAYETGDYNGDGLNLDTIVLLGGKLYIYQPFTISSAWTGQRIGNLKITGQSSMSPYIYIDIPAGTSSNINYAITLDPSSFKDTNLEIDNIQPSSPTGNFNYTGFLNADFSSTVPNGMVFQSYNWDNSNAGFIGLNLLGFQQVHLFNFENYGAINYISSGKIFTYGGYASSGAIFVSGDTSHIFDYGGILTANGNIKFLYIGNAGSHFTDDNFYMGAGNNIGEYGQSQTFTIDTLIIENFTPMNNYTSLYSFSPSNTYSGLYFASSSGTITINNLIMKHGIYPDFLTTNSNFITTAGASYKINHIEIEDIIPNSSGYTWVNLPTQLTTNGTTAGTVFMDMVFNKRNYQKYVIQFTGYENDTTTAQSINYPIPFNHTAVITGNNTGLTISTTTSGITITSPNSTTTYSGIVIVEGY
jgi:hypothetical protein